MSSYDALMTGVVFAGLRADGHATDGMRSSCFLMRSLYRLDFARADDPLLESGEDDMRVSNAHGFLYCFFK